MHVKWETHNPSKVINGQGKNLKVSLVKTHQENSSAKPQLIEHLGVIEEKFLISNVRNMREFHQGLFWATVDKNLDRLSLDPHHRKRIEADIAQTVSRPNEDWALWGVTCIPRFDL